MPTIAEYRIWCVTDARHESKWQDDTVAAPTTCPANAAHTIDATRTTIVGSAPVHPWKDSVRAFTVQDAVLSGEQTLGGVALVAGDRVILAGQNGSGSFPSADVENGPWLVQAGAWIRPSDYNDSADIWRAAIYPITEGTYQDALASLVTNGAITPDTTVTEWTLSSVFVPWMTENATPPASGELVLAPPGMLSHRAVYGSIALTATAIAGASILIEVETGEGTGVYWTVALHKVGAGLTSEISGSYHFLVGAGIRYRFTRGGALGVTETITSYSYADL
jgi:hypothetical protein